MPYSGTFFGSVKYRYPKNDSFIGMTMSEQRLVTSPKMAFEDLLINLLQVIGIFLGLSISDCFRSLTNGLIYLNNQRISYMKRSTLERQWAWHCGEDQKAHCRNTQLLTSSTCY